MPQTPRSCPVPAKCCCLPLPTETAGWNPSLCSASSGTSVPALLRGAVPEDRSGPPSLGTVWPEGDHTERAAGEAEGSGLGRGREEPRHGDFCCGERGSSCRGQAGTASCPRGTAGGCGALSPAQRGQQRRSPPGPVLAGAAPAGAPRSRRRCPVPLPARRSAGPGALPALSATAAGAGRALPAPGARSRLPPDTKFSSRNSGRQQCGAGVTGERPRRAPLPGGGRRRPCHAGLPPRGGGGAGGQRRPMRLGRPGGG